MSARDQFPQIVEIRTIEEAMDLIESWERAHRELVRSAWEEANRLQDKIFRLELRLTIERADRALEKLGIPPASECPF